MFIFREINPADAKLILDWRTSKRVTEFMNIDVQYDLEAQSKWLCNSNKKDHYYHWIIQSNGKDVGLINFVDWNKDNRIVSWGIYIGDEDALGVGGMVPPYFHNFCFEQLGVDTVLSKVFFTNTNTIKLHLLYGYSFTPKLDFVIKKNGQDILMVTMALNRDQFINSRFAKFKAEFPVERWEYKSAIRVGPPSKEQPPNHDDQAN